MSLLTPPVYEAGGLRASDVKTLLAQGAVPRRLDRQGVAALLWRGAAMGARLPVVGVTRVAPPGPPTDNEPANPPRTTDDEFRATLSAAMERGQPRAVDAVSGLKMQTDEERLAYYLATVMDMPSVTGLRACWDETGLPGLIGKRELFGADPVMLAFAAAPRPVRRPRPGGDPLDMRDQRAREVRCFAEIDSQRIHALTAVLPAATRAALSTTGPRPPDGIAPGTHGLALASDETSARSRDPLDAAARGPLRAFIDRTLVRDRLESQGLLVPDAVSEALARFRRGEGGWTAEAILLFALLTEWVERNGLTLEAP